MGIASTSAEDAVLHVPEHLALVPSQDLRLRRVAQPVGRVTDEIRRLIGSMFDIMYREQGVGLAAPQVGCLARAIVVDVRPFQRATQPLALINPRILAARGGVTETEGCLSLPGIEAPVRRAQFVEVAAIGLDGEPLQLSADALLARALQHEIDHLDGILFIDRLTWAQRWRVRRALATVSASPLPRRPARPAPVRL